jgi:hypothetical protein
MNFFAKEYDLTTIEGFKEYLCYLCDLKVATQNAAGFTFDGKQFSLSEKAQFNWLSLLTLQSTLTFPKQIGTLDNTGYSLSQANLMPFIGTALSAVDATLEECRSKKALIMDCATMEELKQITV